MNKVGYAWCIETFDARDRKIARTSGYTWRNTVFKTPEDIQEWESDLKRDIKKHIPEVNHFVVLSLTRLN